VTVSAPSETDPVGYAALVGRHQLVVLPHHRWSFLARRGRARELADGRTVLRLDHLDARTMTDVEHALFALKHDGTNLEILRAFFEAADRATLEEALVEKLARTPSGRYHRQLWFLYEWLTGRRLPVADLGRGVYVPLLDPKRYYTGPARRVPRQRIVLNVLGNASFSPLVRRTERLARRTPEALRAAIAGLVAAYEPETLARALAYLYTKETISSFAIERETPKPDRAARFASLLRRVSQVGELSEEKLAELQASIVEPRFAEHGFRTVQNYVGESLGLHRQRVHFVPPKPEDVGELMSGWLDALAGSVASDTDPVVWAAALSFGFVLIHPFVDGNGRLHRFLIHYVLAERGLTDEGVIIPVSAVMLSRAREYDACLEAFSEPLSQIVRWQMHDDGSITVHGDTALHYRYFDATVMAEHLYDWLDEAVNKELRGELEFLVGYRKARDAMAAVVEMPDALSDLFVKVALQNGGALSARKRKSAFSMLDDEEVAELEAIVRRYLPVSGLARPGR
jgi:hypothetical protein